MQITLFALSIRIQLFNLILCGGMHQIDLLSIQASYEPEDFESGWLWCGNLLSIGYMATTEGTDGEDYESESHIEALFIPLYRKG